MSVIRKTDEEGVYEVSYGGNVLGTIRALPEGWEYSAADEEYQGIAPDRGQAAATLAKHSQGKI